MSPVVVRSNPRPRGSARLAGRRFAALSALLLILLARSGARAEPQPGSKPALPPTISVDELRPGQRGFTDTTLRGSQPVRFPVEVLGVMRNARPRQDMVIIRLEGEPITHTGIIMGMSGSPVYIDGRLAGAIAYTWTYAKEPIAGVTPIQNMLKLLEDSPGPPARRPRGAQPASLSLASFFLRRDDAENPPQAGVPAGLFVPSGGAGPLGLGSAALGRFAATTPSTGSLVRLPPAVSVAGLPPDGLGRLARAFERAGCVTVAGGSGGGKAGGEPAGPVAFEPGSPLVVQLVRGDIQVSALGTVTAVVGDRVVGFGHALMGQPGMELPLATGTIEAVIPSRQVSLKLWSVAREVGVTERDGLAGLVGRLGGRAPMIPVTLSVSRRDVGREDTYHFEIARHPVLTPNLLGTVVSAVMGVGGTPSPDSSAHLVSTFEPAGYPALRYDDWFSGSGLAEQVARELTYVPGLLLENPFGAVELNRIAVSVEVVPERRFAVIESINLKEATVRPGETVEVEVTLAPYRRARERRTLRLKVPPEAPPGPRVLVVADARSEARLDLLARRHHYEPRSLPQLMSLLSEEFKQTRIYGRLSRGNYGVAIQGVELPDLPASVMQILTSPLETDRSAIIGSVRTSIETPWVVQGLKACYIRVTDEQERDKGQ